MATVIQGPTKSSGPADAIVKVINEAAKMQQSKVEIQKTLALDAINRQRNLEDKRKELQLTAEQNTKNASSWYDNLSGNPAPLSNDGTANSQTSYQIGDNPSAPVSVPQTNYSAENPPPYSAVDQSQQPAIDARDLAQTQPQPQMQPQMRPQARISAPRVMPELQGHQLIDPRAVYANNGGKIDHHLVSYAMTYKKLADAQSKGVDPQLSEGEEKMLLKFNDIESDGHTILPGIDTLNLSPDEIAQQLKIKNPGRYALLESFKDGRANLSGRSSKENNRIMEEVQTLWPGTDLTLVKSRVDTRKDFTSGKESTKVQALNTALSHLDRTYENADKLDNGSFRFGNKLGNILKTQTGDSRVRVLDSDINAVTGELSNIFKATGATDTEIKYFKESLSSADSKKTVQDVIKEFIHLIAGRTQPSLEKWQNVFGPESSFPVVGKSGQKILNKYNMAWDPSTGNILDKANEPTPSGKTYAGLTVQQAREQGYTGFDTEKNQWVK